MEQITATDEAIQELSIPLDKIDFDPSQPRQAFYPADGQIDPLSQSALEELAETIASGGLVQAITVEETGDGRYRIVVGERRYRAHLLLHKQRRLAKPVIRAVVKNGMSGIGRIAVQLTENLARQQLTDWEIARTVKILKATPKEHGADGRPVYLKQYEIAKMLGMSEGSLVRYITYGDEALHAKWSTMREVDGVQTAVSITEGADALYRVAGLPEHLQEEILARVGRRELDIPLSREVLRYYADRKKAFLDKKGEEEIQPAKVSVPAGVVPTAENGPHGGGLEPPAAGEQIFPGAAAPTLEGVAALLESRQGVWREGSGLQSNSAQSIAEALAEGGPLAVIPERPAAPALTGAAPSGGYQLPAEAAAELRSPIQATESAGKMGLGMLRVPFVPIRAGLEEVAALSKLGIKGVQVDAKIPRDQAEKLVRDVFGYDAADEIELAALMQKMIVEGNLPDTK